VVGRSRQQEPQRGGSADERTHGNGEVLRQTIHNLNALLDDLIRPRQQRRRDREPERPGGLEVECRRLLDRNVRAERHLRRRWRLWLRLLLAASLQGQQRAENPSQRDQQEAAAVHAGDSGAGSGPESTSRSEDCRARCTRSWALTASTTRPMLLAMLLAELTDFVTPALRSAHGRRYSASARRLHADPELR
jgi:hypothetical protein